MSFGASIQDSHAYDEATDLAEDFEANETESLAKLVVTSPPSSAGPVIAIDLDDVLSQTNRIVAQWHNEKYGTDMDLSTFYYYYYWKNPYWGTPAETFAKIKEFYSLGLIHNAPPVPGAREGVQALRDMGYRLIIVTARNKDVADESWIWANTHFPGIFDSVVCTGHFKAAMDDQTRSPHEVLTKLTKAEVCIDLNAKLLIDDSVENGLQCATSSPPTPALLFGDYEWNKRQSFPTDHRDDMSFNNRLEAAGGKKFWNDDAVQIPEGVPLYRIKDWAQVISWVKRARTDGKL